MSVCTPLKEFMKKTIFLKEDLRLVCIRLPKNLHLSAKKRALEQERTLKDLISEVLQDYLKSITEKA